MTGADLQVEIALIGLIQAVVVAAITGLFVRDSRKREKTFERAEARANLRTKENLLAIQLMSASVNLGIATAYAIRDGKTNGAMHGALDEAEQAGAAYRDFIKEVAAGQIA